MYKIIFVKERTCKCVNDSKGVFKDTAFGRNEKNSCKFCKQVKMLQREV